LTIINPAGIGITPAAAHSGADRIPFATIGLVAQVLFTVAIVFSLVRVDDNRIPALKQRGLQIFAGALFSRAYGVC
jgi:hypothetical protein